MRFAVAKKIVERAADFGIPREDVVVDPLVMPVGAINDAGARLMHLIRRLHGELKVNTSCGASNFSFGLPNRRGLNAGFLPMMIGAGLTSAIMNPLHPEDRQAILGADVVMGHDPNCGAWITRLSRAARRRARAAAGAKAGAGREAEHERRIGSSSPRRASATRSRTGFRVLEAARKLGVDLDSVCGGRGICGRCQVDVADGEFAKHALVSAQDHVTPWGAVEQRYADKRGAFAPGRRLGCQARICGDLVVDVPAESQVHRQVVRKRAETHPIDIDPVVRLHYVEVAEPDMHDPSSDLRRLQQALSEQWGLGETRASLPVLRGLQKTLRKGLWKVTVAVRKGEEIVAVQPGFTDRAFGVAFDIGSTTIAAHLSNLETGEVVASCGAMNPQIRFGEDLMSRVSYVMMNPGGDADLTSARARLRRRVDWRGRRGGGGRARRRFSRSRSRAIRSCIISFSASTRPNSAARPSR